MNRCNTCQTRPRYNYCWVNQEPRIGHYCRNDCPEYGDHMQSPVCQDCRQRPALVQCFNDNRLMCYECFSNDHSTCIDALHNLQTVQFSSHQSCGEQAVVAVPAPIDLGLALGGGEQAAVADQAAGAAAEVVQVAVNVARQAGQGVNLQYCFLCRTRNPLNYCWSHREPRNCLGSSHEAVRHATLHLQSPLCQDCRLLPAFIECHFHLTKWCPPCFNAHHQECVNTRHPIRVIPFTSHYNCAHHNPKPIEYVLKNKNARKRKRRGSFKDNVAGAGQGSAPSAALG